MKTDRKVIFLEVKRQVIWFVVGILFIYLFIVPYQMNLLKRFQDIEDIKIIFFSNLQRYLPVVSIWYSFWFLRDMLESDCREIIYSLDRKPKVRFLLYLFCIYIIIVLPASIRFLSIYSENVLDILDIWLEGLFFMLLSYCISYLFCSAIIGFIITFLYSMFMINFEKITVFSIYHFESLIEDLPGYILIIRMLTVAILIIIGIGLEKYSIRRGKLLS